MKNKNYYFLVITLFCVTSLYAQFGIKIGVNSANEIKSVGQSSITDGFSYKSLTGYQIGVVYQVMPKGSGVGCEVGMMFSQKGSTYTDSTNTNSIVAGYKELNYLEVPFNVRYRLTFGFVGIYGIAGIYGGYTLSGKVVQENPEILDRNEVYPTFMDHVDYGYNLGAGIELFKKIQFGATWSQGIKSITNLSSILPTPISIKNRVFSVNMVYLF
jgi:hypothetical protein